MMSYQGSPVGPARTLSPDEVEQIKDLREQFKPEVSRKRVEEFGKWLFASVAMVGTLGAGLSNVAFQNLSRYGKWCFAVAVLSLGVSLAFATIGLAPKKVIIVPDSRDSMRRALSQQVASRHRFLQVATVLFALALVMAALAPFASTFPQRKEPTRVWVNYSLLSDGKLQVQLMGRGLEPYTPVELSLKTEPATCLRVLPRVRGATNASGEVVVNLDMPNANAIKCKLFAVRRWGVSPGEVEALENEKILEIQIRHR